MQERSYSSGIKSVVLFETIHMEEVAQACYLVAQPVHVGRAGKTDPCHVVLQWMGAAFQPLLSSHCAAGITAESGVSLLCSSLLSLPLGGCRPQLLAVLLCLSVCPSLLCGFFSGQFEQLPQGGNKIPCLQRCPVKRILYTAENCIVACCYVINKWQTGAHALIIINCSHLDDGM